MLDQLKEFAGLCFNFRKVLWQIAIAWVAGVTVPFIFCQLGLPWQLSVAGFGFFIVTAVFLNQQHPTEMGRLLWSTAILGQLVGLIAFYSSLI